MFFAQADPGEVVNADVVEQFPSLVETIKADVGYILPELILSAGVCWVILVDVFGKKERSRNLGYHAMAFCAMALAALLFRDLEYRAVFRNLAVHDGYGVFFKALILGGTLICIPMVMMHRVFDRARMGEFYGLLLGSVVGMFLMVSAKSLLMFYVGIEFASITCYLLTAYLKGDRGGSEGGLKYVIYGSVASGAMIYGLSILYGLTGTLDVQAFADELLVRNTVDTTLILAGMLTFAGFAYKMSAFPMHFWCPDVYEGAPTPFTAFLSVVSKAAGFAVFIRFVQAFAADGDWTVKLAGGAVVDVDWPLFVAIVAALTMTVGNLAALFQDNIKRLLAYSSIAHAGYLLMGVVGLVPSREGADAGWQTVAFYLVVYLFMNLGAFLVVTIIANRTGSETVDGYRGLGRRNALLAVALFTFLISLIGLPPTGGFTGKFQLLRSAIDGGYVWLAVVAGVNTAISVYYYARLIKAMFLEEADEGSGAVVIPASSSWFVAAMVVPVFYLGIFFNSTVELIRNLDLSMG